MAAMFSSTSLSLSTDRETRTVENYVPKFANRDAEGRSERERNGPGRTMSTSVILGVLPYLSAVGRAWYSACAVVLTLCFISLACIWVNLVPAFQSPDEPAHFDYAYSLATAGTLLRAADGPAGYDPRIQVLMRDADQPRMAFHADERVPKSYGTDAFFEQVRRETSAYRNYSPLQAGAVRSPLTSVYGFIPYALYAIAAYPFRHDVAASLAACRFASVAITGFAILIWSRILRRLHVGKVHALALLAIVAFFPLTSFIGSYVQTDGVAFLIVSALLLVTLRIRDGHVGARHSVAYAVLVAALYGAKLQFAVTVGLSTIVPVAFAYTQMASVRMRAFTASMLLASMATVFAVTRWVMQGTEGASYFQGRHTLTSALVEHVPTEVTTFLWTEFRVAMSDLYGGGISQQSFWGLFGWLDTPIRIIDYRITDGVSLIETLGTLLAIVTIVASAILGLNRLVRIGRTRSVYVALRLASNDPAFNAYLLFVALFIVLFVVSGNLFRAQGRDWYALEVVAFASASWYGARVFPRQWRRVYSSLVLVSLAALSMAGSAFALTTIEDRFYRPLSIGPYPDVSRLASKIEQTAVTYDSIDVTGRPHSQGVFSTLRLARNARIVLHGWAYDPDVNAPCHAVYAVVDGRFAHFLTYGIERRDVGHFYNNFVMSYTGFEDTVDLSGLPPGRHTIALVCIGASGVDQYTPTSLGDVVLGP